MLGIKLAATIMVTGTGTTTLAALQVIQQQPAVLDDGALIPVGIAVGVLLATVGATIRVVRWIDRVNARFKKLEEAGILPPDDAG